MARAKKLTKWRHIANGVVANSGDLPHVEQFAGQLTVLLDDAEATEDRQLTFAASKQDASQHLLEIESVGGRLATLLTAAVRQRYGPGSEKLTEFGLRPFRTGRPRTVTPPPGPELAKTEPVTDPQQ